MVVSIFSDIVECQSVPDHVIPARASCCRPRFLARILGRARSNALCVSGSDNWNEGAGESEAVILLWKFIPQSLDLKQAISYLSKTREVESLAGLTHSWPDTTVDSSSVIGLGDHLHSQVKFNYLTPFVLAA